jgi:imidazole glycerol-phosphate synthase subunit HisH
VNRKEVVVVDLGAGNLRSVARALERAGATATITADPDAVLRAARVVVPGQGAFRDGAVALEAGFGDALREVIARGTPYLGLCIGMQLLFASSEEAPGKRGLGVLAGSVKRFAPDLLGPDGARLKVPHMGWNEVRGSHRYLPERAWFYFVHSYYCAPDDASLVVGTAQYGHPFCAAVTKDNLFACQFHPEKSQGEGHALLSRFIEDTSWS